MSIKNLPIDPGFGMPNRRPGAYKGAVYLLLATLMVLIAACQSPPEATEQWAPPYLQLHLHAGKARVQWPSASGWMTMEGKASILIEETVRIIADAVEGAQFHLGDGSAIELAPGAVLEVQNPRTFPRLQVILQDGSLLFVAQGPSYELVMPAGSATPLSIPSRIRIEVNGEATHLVVKEGAVTCVLEGGSVTLLAGQEMYVSSGEEPEVTEFHDTSATATASAMTFLPSATPSGFEATPTPTPTTTPTPSPTATPTRRRVVPTRTPTPLPPTDTPPPPPPPPPTQPPPTQPPPTEPPPTEPPPPPPTEPPPTQPPPTEPRPTLPPPTEPPPTEPRPTEPPPPPEQPPTEPPPTEPPPTEPPPTEPPPTEPPPTEPPPTVTSG